MTRTTMLIFLVALGGCRVAPPAPPAAADPLAREIAGRVAGQPQTCVSKFGIQNVRVIDSQTVAYGQGPTIWINRLQAACPALSQFNSLIVEGSAGQFCRGDQVRGLEPGGLIPGPSCNLQEWVPYRLP